MELHLNKNLINIEMDTIKAVDDAFEVLFAKEQSKGRYFNIEDNSYRVVRIVQSDKLYEGKIKEAHIESAEIAGVEFNRIVVTVSMNDGGIDAEIKFSSPANKVMAQKSMLLAFLEALGLIKSLEATKGVPTPTAISKLINSAAGTGFKFGYAWMLSNSGRSNRISNMTPKEAEEANPGSYAWKQYVFTR